MLKQVLSALAISGVMLGTAAFAADAPAAASMPAAPQSQAQTPAAPTQKVTHKVVHKHMKATAVKAEPSKATSPAPAATTN